MVSVVGKILINSTKKGLTPHLLEQISGTHRTLLYLIKLSSPTKSIFQRLLQSMVQYTKKDSAS